MFNQQYFSVVIKKESSLSPSPSPSPIPIYIHGILAMLLFFLVLKLTQQSDFNFETNNLEIRALERKQDTTGALSS